MEPDILGDVRVEPLLLSLCDTGSERRTWSLAFSLGWLFVLF